MCFRFSSGFCPMLFFIAFSNKTYQPSVAYLFSPNKLKTIETIHAFVLYFVPRYLPQQSQHTRHARRHSILRFWFSLAPDWPPWHRWQYVAKNKSYRFLSNALNKLSLSSWPCGFFWFFSFHVSLFFLVVFNAMDSCGFI